MILLTGTRGTLEIHFVVGGVRGKEGTQLAVGTSWK